MNIHQIIPNPDTGGNVSARYFYTDYDPSEHFSYNIIFSKGTIINTTATEQQKQQAWIKCFNYMNSFEQPLPKDFFEFYIVQSNTTNIDSDYQNSLEDKVKVVPDLLELNIQEIDITKIANYNNTGSGTIETRFCYPDGHGDLIYVNKDILSMTYEEASAVYNYHQLRKNSDSQYRKIMEDATRHNKYFYNIADYIRVKYPDEPDDMKISDYNKIIKKVNSTYKTQIPVEPGLYRYSKYKKNWEKVEEVKLNG